MTLNEVKAQMALGTFSHKQFVILAHRTCNVEIIEFLFNNLPKNLSNILNAIYYNPVTPTPAPTLSPTTVHSRQSLQKI